MAVIDTAGQQVQNIATTECSRKPPMFREKTNDAWVWKSVAEENEYFLPESFAPDDLVIDIGLHIGSFSYLALTRGAGHVFAYEADSDNYNLAKANLEYFGERISMFHGAVCRSDIPPAHLFFSGYGMFRNKIINTGGGDVLWATKGNVVTAVPFDKIIDEVTNGGKRRIRMVKFDCEGSEYPILMTSYRLHLIDEIVGEFHEIGCGGDERGIPLAAQTSGFSSLNGNVIMNVLTEHGFACRLGNKTPGFGKFLAWNKRLLPTC